MTPAEIVATIYESLGVPRGASEAEAKEVQDSYLSQNPWAKYIVDTLKAQQKNAAAGRPRANGGRPGRRQLRGTGQH